jgi:hypothetical protein
MKLSFLFLALIGLVIGVEAQTVVKMEQVGGVFTVPCKVNGLELKFVPNTVNPDVSISLETASEMLKDGYLYEKDLTGPIQVGSEINLSIIEIGAHFVYNTKAVVVGDLQFPLIIGKKILDQLGNIDLNYATSDLIITDEEIYKNSYGVKYGCASGNCLNGHGAYLYPGGAVYVGDFKDGDLMGYGTYLYEDGTKYIGYFISGDYQGKGVLMNPDGSIFVGDFVDGEFNGFGRMAFANGQKYAGDFVDGIFNGYGVFTFVSGQKYSGDFVDGKYNGNGTMIFANGQIYVGEFTNNKRNGKGTLTSPDGTVKAGTFRNGEYVGQ